MNKLSVYKEKGRLCCSCGYRSERRGWNCMIDHLIYAHGIPPIGLASLLQDLWLNRAVKLTFKKAC